MLDGAPSPLAFGAAAAKATPPRGSWQQGNVRGGAGAKGNGAAARKPAEGARTPERRSWLEPEGAKPQSTFAAILACVHGLCSPEDTALPTYLLCMTIAARQPADGHDVCPRHICSFCRIENQ